MKYDEFFHTKHHSFEYMREIHTFEPRANTLLYNFRLQCFYQWLILIFQSQGIVYVPFQLSLGDGGRMQIFKQQLMMELQYGR